MKTRAAAFFFFSFFLFFSQRRRFPISLRIANDRHEPPLLSFFVSRRGWHNVANSTSKVSEWISAANERNLGWTKSNVWSVMCVQWSTRVLAFLWSASGFSLNRTFRRETSNGKVEKETTIKRGREIVSFWTNQRVVKLFARIWGWNKKLFDTMIVSRNCTRIIELIAKCEFIHEDNFICSLTMYREILLFCFFFFNILDYVNQFLICFILLFVWFVHRSYFVIKKKKEKKKGNSSRDCLPRNINFTMYCQLFSKLYISQNHWNRKFARNFHSEIRSVPTILLITARM